MGKDIEVHSFEELSDKLHEMVENLNGEKNIEEIFTPEFMRVNTNHSNIQEFFKAGKFNVSSQKDFESIPIEKLDAFVLKTTKFKNWDEMKSRACVEYAKKNL